LTRWRAEDPFKADVTTGSPIHPLHLDQSPLHRRLLEAFVGQLAAERRSPSPVVGELLTRLANEGEPKHLPLRG